MKHINILINLVLVAFIAISCQPKKGKDEELPAPSIADFEIIQVTTDPTDKNTFTFKNTTSGAFISSWDFGGLSKSSSSNETVFFGYKGTYKIKLLTTSKGGTTTVTKDLVVEEDSPYSAQFDIQNEGSHKFKVISKALNPTFQIFKFENGDSSAIDTVIYFPFKGSFDITLKVITAKGASAITKTVDVADDDLSNPALTNDVFKFLTGGLEAVNGKTWVLAKAYGSGGVGAKNLDWPNYYDSPNGPGGPPYDDGMLSNEFTFKMREYQYIPKSTAVTANWAYANKYFGKNQAQYQDIALSDPNHKQAPFILKPSDNGPFGQGWAIDIANDSYLGYFDKRFHNEIIKISEDSLVVRHSYNEDDLTAPIANDPNARYFKFVPKK